MLRDAVLIEDEHYHVFNRGAHKQNIFLTPSDYDRFLVLLFLANTQNPFVMRNVLTKYKGRSLVNVYAEEVVENPLVDILAYTLMPNHFHLLLKQKTENGISIFMKKVGTGFSMYFNKKHNHSGVVFQGRFQSRHISTEAYFRYIFAYIQLNPLALTEPGWEEKGVRKPAKARTFLNEYRFSSFYDYSVEDRPERKILASEQVPDFIKNENDFEQLLSSYRAYAKDRPMYT